jgi:hypothetical protein
LLNDALKFAIFMSLKFKDEIDFATFDNVMEGDPNVVFELSFLASNIKKEIVGVLDSFFYLLKKYEKKFTYLIFLDVEP